DYASGHPRLMKMGLGANSPPVLVMDNLASGLTRWSPDGRWLTAVTPDGFYVVSPDGSVKRKIGNSAMLTHEWSRDSSSVFGVRVDDNMHLLLSRVTLDGTERVMADLGISPPATVPLDGFNLSPDGKTFLAGILKPKGDLWVLQGF